MASISRRIIFPTGKSPFRVPRRQIAPRRTARWLSSTPQRLVGNDPIDGRPENAPAKPIEGTPTTSSAESVPLRERKVPLSKEELQAQEREYALRKLSEDLEALDPDTALEAIRQNRARKTVGDEFEMPPDEVFDIAEEKGKIGFWGEGEEELGPDEDYYGDDITSLGHGELEQHRELREYARLAAWELPLLNQLARPFELPTAKTPFRFRYTSYLGESHPAANKVVVEFSASDMVDLSSKQKDKLIKLAGPRYNPSTDIIKMSCELFDTLPQNKRWLGDTIKALLHEVKTGKDDFADVPFDFRHHKPKTSFEFPREWILTEKRKQYLAEKRHRAVKFEDERKNNGLLIDGTKMIENSMPLSPVAEPVTVSAGGLRKQLR